MLKTGLALWLALLRRIPWLVPGALLLAGGIVVGSGLNPAGGSLARRFFDQAVNYTDPSGPLYRGDFAAEPGAIPDQLLVVTYNLKYAEAVDEAIVAFRAVAPLPQADIILMQEMDAPATERIARELRYNYVYYPASVAEDGDDFGNAILSRWPIYEPAKLILPGLHPLSGQQRIATRANIRIGDKDVLVYSAHTEIATAPGALREGQVAAILADIPAEAPWVIIGGDFNNVTSQSVGELTDQFAASGLSHATSGLGPTVTRYGLRPSAADHIFTRGFTAQDAGVLRDVLASDHYPLWVRLGW